MAFEGIERHGISTTDTNLGTAVDQGGADSISIVDVTGAPAGDALRVVADAVKADRSRVPVAISDVAVAAVVVVELARGVPTRQRISHSILPCALFPLFSRMYEWVIRSLLI